MSTAPLPFAWVTSALTVLLALPAFSLSSDSASTRYAGSELCAKCHKDIAASQSTTAMAKTWDAASTLPFPANLDQKKIEGPDPAISYEVRRVRGKLEFSTSAAHGGSATLPVEAAIGGKRHGVSFLTRILELDGVPLARPALIEARYAYSAEGSLILSPGFPAGKPAALETALGHVLSPGFEQKCLSCHGQPGTAGAGKLGGVHCESCHGAAAEHVDSLTGSGHQMIRPASLAGSKSMEVCAPCHTGLNNINHADPVPGDLMVSSQVSALQQSECFRQSGGQVTCTQCHDPHRDAPASVMAERSARTCLSCHSAAVPRHASICPINASSGCTGCHMPSIKMNGFSIADHWIAVHPEQDIKAEKTTGIFPSQVTPKREDLQMIATDNQAKAEVTLQRLAAGARFYDVAHQASIDSTASAGGYLGDLQLSDMDPPLAAAAANLWYGESSSIIHQGGRYLILHRLPRDFRWQANQLFLEAVRLQSIGDRQSAAAKAKEALKVYPYFLRAHIFLGTQLAESGNDARAESILAFASQAYPTDGFAQFRYAITLGKHPASQIDAFRRAIKLEPDIPAAYERLSATLASSGDMPAAMQVVRQGLAVNPLSAVLNYDLGIALQEQGDKAGAKPFLSLANALDPSIVARLNPSADQ